MRRAALPLALVTAAVAALAAPAAAGPRVPDFRLTVGGTAAVSGDPSNGGFSLGGTALWPVEGPWRFGVTGFADDMGTQLDQILRLGPPVEKLGATETHHRFVWGGEWRLEAQLPAKGRWTPTAHLTWGVMRVQDDARGVVIGAESAVSSGFGFGIRRPVLQRSTVGATVQVHRLSNDRVRSYASAGVEWGWRFGMTP